MVTKQVQSGTASNGLQVSGKKVPLVCMCMHVCMYETSVTIHSNVLIGDEPPAGWHQHAFIYD